MGISLSNNWTVVGDRSLFVEGQLEHAIVYSRSSPHCMINKSELCSFDHLPQMTIISCAAR